MPVLDDKGLPVGYMFKDEWEITPRQVKRMMDGRENFVFIDCRNASEYELTHIEGTRLIPLDQLEANMDELQKDRSLPIVVHCKVGGRSLRFAQALRQRGFENVRSMAGGIVLWNTDINPNGPKY